MNSRLKYVRMKDILACFVFLFMLPIALIGKIFVRRFWLVGEEKCEARDNAYWFFKYVRENYPNQKIAYAIDKKCADYKNVKDLGKTVQWGSLSHWFWYLVAEKNISSQKGCKPNAAACYFFEISLKLWRNKRYFLQHGVTINDVKWAYCDQSRFRLFVCSGNEEYDFVKSNFGYPENVVQCLGQCRFDRLYNIEPVKNLILVMPTWRSNLVRPHGLISAQDLKKSFSSSQYFEKWSALLESKKLGALLKANDCHLLFYPHRNMQIYLEMFRNLDLAEHIAIANPAELSVQQALMDAACLITDYSSIFVDFAYMKKPLIFYQFDEKEFRENQYAEGYFDYHNNPLGQWSDTLAACLQLLESLIINGFPKNENAESFFRYHDNKNCERNYLAVRDME